MQEFMVQLGIWVLAPFGALGTVFTIWQWYASRRAAPPPPLVIPEVAITSENDDRVLLRWDADRRDTPGTLEHTVAQFLTPLAPMYWSDVFIEQPRLFVYIVGKRMAWFRQMQWFAPLLAILLGAGALLFVSAAVLGRPLNNTDLPPLVLAFLWGLPVLPLWRYGSHCKRLADEAKAAIDAIYAYSAYLREHDIEIRREFTQPRTRIGTTG